MLANIRNRLDSLKERWKGTPDSLPLPTAPTLPFYKSYPSYTVPQVVARVPRFLRRKSSVLCWCILGPLLFCATWLIAQRCGPLLSTDKSKWSYDIPGGVATHACISGDEWILTEGPPVKGLPHSRMTTVNISLAGGLALVSRGQLAAGEVNYVASPHQMEGTATIDIQAWFQRHELMSLVKACAVTRKHRPGEDGLGLFTPTWHWLGPIRLEDRMTFVTTVVVPGGSQTHPTKISGLFSDLPNTSVKMHDLAGVSFDEVHLLSTNGAIEVRDLRSDGEVHVSTTNGAIRGKLQANTRLNIRTTNAEVDIDAGLHHDGTHTPGKVDVQTTHGKIRAGINLYSLSHTGGRFEVDTVTSEAESSVRIGAVPLHSNLQIQSHTCNAAAELTLPSTFEGDFVATNTAWSKIRINVDKTARDPSGSWRMRNLLSLPDLEDSRGHVKSGKIIWGFGSERSKLGYAMLSTTGDLSILNL